MLTRSQANSTISAEIVSSSARRTALRAASSLALPSRLRVWSMAPLLSRLRFAGGRRIVFAHEMLAPADEPVDRQTQQPSRRHQSIDGGAAERALLQRDLAAHAGHLGQ